MAGALIARAIRLPKRLRHHSIFLGDTGQAVVQIGNRQKLRLRRIVRNDVPQCPHAIGFVAVVLGVGLRDLHTAMNALAASLDLTAAEKTVGVTAPNTGVHPRYYVLLGSRRRDNDVSERLS